MGHKITPFLWFDTEAEDAANFYVSVFKDAEITSVNRHGEGGPAPAGTAITVSFRLKDLNFTALNAGPEFTFTEAVSFAIDCKDQDEIDYYWEALSQGGETSACGWLKDKYGLSWQVTPWEMEQLMGDAEPERANRVMTAMLQMTKIDIATLKAAYDNA